MQVLHITTHLLFLFEALIFAFLGLHEVEILLQLYIFDIQKLSMQLTPAYVSNNKIHGELLKDALLLWFILPFT